MDGPTVYRHAVQLMTEVTEQAVRRAGLTVAERDGRLPDGDRVLLAAFGAGLVWGGVVVTWGRPVG